MADPNSTCTVPGCQRKRATYSSGVCGMHYMRMRRRGTFDAQSRGKSAEYLAAIRPTPKAVYASACEHSDRRHYAHGLCGPCYNRRVRPNKQRAWLDANTVTVKRYRRSAVLRRHGLTCEDYDAMLAAQGGKCANHLCGVEGVPTAVSVSVRVDHRHQSLQVDHDHVTGKVRGLLCKSCNSALGHAADDLSRLRGLVVYLESLN